MTKNNRIRKKCCAITNDLKCAIKVSEVEEKKMKLKTYWIKMI